MIDVEKLKKRAFIQQEAGDFGLAVAAQFDAVNTKIETVKTEVTVQIDQVANDLKEIELTPGPKGDIGEMGPKPIAGIDYPIPENGKDGAIGPMGPKPILGKDYTIPEPIVGPPGPRGESIIGPRGKDGSDGSPDTATQIKEKLETLKGESRLDASAIKNLPDVVNQLPVIQTFTGGGSGSGVKEIVAGANISVTKTDSGKYTITGLATPTTPGSPDTSVQFNDGGVFGGDAGLTYDKNTNTLSGGTLKSTEGYILSRGPSDPFIDLENTDNPGIFAGLELTSSGILRVYTDGSQIRFMDNIDLQGIAIGGSLIPDTDDSYDIGSSTKAWGGLYLGPDEVIYFGNNEHIYQGVGVNNSLFLTAPSGHTVNIANTFGGFSAKLNVSNIATSDKTFTFPNSSGTIALVPGSDTQIIYNSSGALAGASNFTYDGSRLFLSNDFPFTFGGGSGNTSSFKTGSDGTFLFDTGANVNIKLKGTTGGGTTMAYTDGSFTTQWAVDSAGNSIQNGTLGIGASGTRGTISSSLLSTTRTYQLPDASGTFVLGGSSTGGLDRLTSATASAGKTLIYTHDGTDGTLTNSTGALSIIPNGRLKLDTTDGYIEVLNTDGFSLFDFFGSGGTQNAGLDVFSTGSNVVASIDALDNTAAANRFTYFQATSGSGTTSATISSSIANGTSTAATLSPIDFDAEVLPKTGLRMEWIVRGAGSAALGFIGIDNVGRFVGGRPTGGSNRSWGFQSTLGDSSTTIAYEFDTLSTLSTSGALHTSWKNNTSQIAKLDFNGVFTASKLNLSATSSQLVFQSAGVTGTISWAPATSNKTITLPNGSTDFTATGGTGQFLKQSSAGAAITVATIASSDLPGSFSGFANPTNPGVNLTGSNGSATTAMRSDAVLILDQSIAPTWSGTHTFSLQDIHTLGISLSTSGVIKTAVATGAGGTRMFDLQDTVSRDGTATVQDVFTIRNTVDSISLMTVTSDGRFGFGYWPGSLVQNEYVLGFLIQTQVHPSASAGLTSRGILAYIDHRDTAITPSKLQGIAGFAAINAATATLPTSAMIDGVVGTAGCIQDTASAGSKYIAGVRGQIHNTSNPSGITVDSPFGLGAQFAGNFIHAACFFADFAQYGAMSTTPTNTIGIVSSFRCPIQVTGSSESWGIRGESTAPTTPTKNPVTTSGFMRVAFPQNTSATNRTHLYFVPHNPSAGGPTWASSGGVYFDDGTNNKIGLHEYDGTAWRKLMVADKNFAVTGTWTFNPGPTPATNGGSDIGANGLGWGTLWLKDTAASFELKVNTTNTSISADRTLTFNVLDADKTLTLDVSTRLNSGVYTPTRSAEANMDANVTMTQAQYSRNGSVVTVSGRFTADPTLTATTSSFEMTLPIASNIGAVEDVAGVAFCGSIAAQGAEIIGVVANDTAKVQWKAADVTSQTWSYTFTYRII